MRILITGADGFIGKNLRIRLSEVSGHVIETFTKQDPVESLVDKVANVDVVFHLAGINRPNNEAEYMHGNKDLSMSLCEALKFCNHSFKVIFASSIQAELDTPYGASKKAAEQVFTKFAQDTDSQVSVFRLPNVFGKWCRPNYNSVVATFSHNIANDIPINIHDPETILRLVYIDDVVSGFLQYLESENHGFSFNEISPEYEVNLGNLAKVLYEFRNSRKNLLVGEVGEGLKRALYATYLSYLPPDNFTYPLLTRKDARGSFVEVLKTPDCGQFSYLTAGPGVTRGGHYHHTKNEKFLVVHGRASFKFRHLVSNEIHEVTTSSEQAQIVETIPGWVHDITNVGNSELIVMVWANEIFDVHNPDTIGAAIDA